MPEEAETSSDLLTVNNLDRLCKKSAPIIQNHTTFKSYGVTHISGEGNTAHLGDTHYNYYLSSSQPPVPLLVGGLDRAALVAEMMKVVDAYVTIDRDKISEALSTKVEQWTEECATNYEGSRYAQSIAPASVVGIGSMEDSFSSGMGAPILPIDDTELHSQPLHEQRLLDSLRSELTPQLLSSKYRVAVNARQFFQPGCVFSVLWHENAGLQQRVQQSSQHQPRTPRNTVVSRYGEQIFSRIRPMVVIQNRRGYSLCVGINSYGGQGTLKSGLTQEERNAHAIIYSIGKQPKKLKYEPMMLKRPIGVRMADDETLSEAARIHFGQIFSVEWNVKTKKMGQVQEEDMHLLSDYTKEELFGRQTMGNKEQPPISFAEREPSLMPTTLRIGEEAS